MTLKTAWEKVKNQWRNVEQSRPQFIWSWLMITSIGCVFLPIMGLTYIMSYVTDTYKPSDPYVFITMFSYLLMVVSHIGTRKRKIWGLTVGLGLLLMIIVLNLVNAILYPQYGFWRRIILVVILYGVFVRGLIRQKAYFQDR